MKKGYTLMEVLAVVVILSILSMIVFPSVIKTVKKSKENLYQSQLRELEMVTKNFSLENKDLLDKNYLNDAYISLEDLKKSKYLEQSKISNPKTGDDMNGCMRISYNHENNQYNFEYVDTDCKNDSTISGYIISYNNGFVRELKGTIIKSAYEEILEINKDKIYTIGNTSDGLYDIDNEYIFRGKNVSNFAKIGSDVYRIISLNKNDKTLKLIKVTPESTSYSTNNNNEFTTSSISEYLLNLTINGNLSNYLYKIMESNKWKNGIVNISESNDYENLKLLESDSTISNRLGIINVSDYIIASLSDNCLNNIMSIECQNNNYLYDIFKNSNVWTMDKSTLGKVITIESGTITDHSLNLTTDSSYGIYPVVIIKKSGTIKSGDGTSSSKAYVIE